MAKYGLSKYGADSSSTTATTGSMDGSALQSALNTLVGDTVPCETALVWFNDAISELTDKLKIEAKATIATTQGTLSYDIPYDVLSIVKCDLSFSVWANEIIFDSDPGTGSTNLYYYRRVNKLALISDIPTDIPSNYHYALVLFAAMRYKQADEEMQQAQEFERQFNAKKAMMINEVRDKVVIRSVKNSFYMG